MSRMWGRRRLKTGGGRGKRRGDGGKEDIILDVRLGRMRREG